MCRGRAPGTSPPTRARPGAQTGTGTCMHRRGPCKGYHEDPSVGPSAGPHAFSSNARPRGRGMGRVGWRRARAMEVGRESGPLALLPACVHTPFPCPCPCPFPLARVDGPRAACMHSFQFGRQPPCSRGGGRANRAAKRARAARGRTQRGTHGTAPGHAWVHGHACEVRLGIRGGFVCLGGSASWGRGSPVVSLKDNV